MALNTYPGIPGGANGTTTPGWRTLAWAATEMLRHAEPVLVLGKFGQMKPHMRNKTDTVTFRRRVPFGAVTTPLTEGSPPTGQNMSYIDVPVTLKQYGGLVEISDVVNDMAEDPVLKDASLLLGEQAGATIEQLIWAELKSGATNVVYSNGTATSAVNTAISLNNIRSAVRTLKANKGMPVTRMLDGSPNYNTTPIEGGYIAFTHTDMEHDIRNIAGFTPVAEYGSRKPLSPYEFGSIENVRFITSPDLDANLGAGNSTLNGMISDGGSNVDVYSTVIIAQDAYGQVPLKGKESIRPVVIPPDRADKSDPLGQKGIVGWKTYFAAKVLNSAWLVEIQSGATDL